MGTESIDELKKILKEKMTDIDVDCIEQCQTNRKAAVDKLAGLVERNKGDSKPAINAREEIRLYDEILEKHNHVRIYTSKS